MVFLFTLKVLIGIQKSCKMVEQMMEPHYDNSHTHDSQ